MGNYEKALSILTNAVEISGDEYVTVTTLKNYGLSVNIISYGRPVVAQNPQKLVATVSRREGVYNRTGEPSVIFAEKEELHSE